MPLEVGEIRIRGHFCALKPNLERRGCLVQALQDQAAQPGTEQKKSGSTDQVLNMANAPQLTPKVPHGANTPASTPPVNAEALRVTSKNAALMPDNSIQQSGENYHNNSQSPLETGNTTAKTDSTALVLQQQYQTEIAAIREDLTLADLYEIVKEEAGTGDMIKKADRSFKEFVDCDEITGYSYNKKLGGYVPTYRAQIMYSLGDRNIHIVPVKRLNEVKK